MLRRSTRLVKPAKTLAVEDDSNSSDDKEDNYSVEEEELTESEEESRKKDGSEVSFEAEEIDEDNFKRRKRISTAKNRLAVSMAKANVPAQHSRLRGVGDNKKRFKFRTVAVTNQKSTVFNIHDYIYAVRQGHNDFCQALVKDGICASLLKTKKVRWKEMSPDKMNLSKWLNRSSVRLDVQTKKSESASATQEQIFSRNRDNSAIKIFQSHAFDYRLETKNHECTSFLVDTIIRNKRLQRNQKIKENLLAIQSDPNSRKRTAQALFCGGPILAIKACPQKAADESEVVAIVTVADELQWEHGLSTPNYVQLWKFDGNDFSNKARLWFLLKIEHVGTIADICWCPLFSEAITSELAVDKDLLGYLAVTSDYGKVLVYRIDKNMPNARSEPPIFFADPIWTLQHPPVTVKEVATSDDANGNNNDRVTVKEEANDVEMEDAANDTVQSAQASTPSGHESNDDELEEELRDLIDQDIFIEREITMAPFIHLCWSPHKKGKDLLAVSATGWIILWDLSRENPEQAADWVYDDSWESSPTSAALLSDNLICLGFPTNKLIYYDLETKTVVYEDQNQRSTGAFVTAEQMSFPGCFSYDIVKIIPEPSAVQYFCSSYQVLDLSNQTGLTVQPINRHMGQCLHLAVCPNSGIVGTVGMDGRVVESLIGRLAPRGTMDDFACSNVSPALQLVRRTRKKTHAVNDLMEAVDNQKGADKEPAAKPLILHDDVVENCWLEVRLGDAALIDQKSASICKTSIEKATYNRRLESLMRIDFSRYNGGVACAGGEAGIVFIIPTSL